MSNDKERNRVYVVPQWPRITTRTKRNALLAFIVAFAVGIAWMVARG